MIFDARMPCFEKIKKAYSSKVKVKNNFWDKSEIDRNFSRDTLYLKGIFFHPHKLHLWRYSVTFCWIVYLIVWIFSRNRTPPRNLDSRATITIGDRTFVVEADNLEKICDLGRGAYGIVEKMRHRETGTVMAVKRIASTINTQEQVNFAYFYRLLEQVDRVRSVIDM